MALRRPHGMPDHSINVAIWSADWHGTNGQAIVTRHVVEGVKFVNWTFANYRVGHGRALSSVLRATLIIWWALLYDQVQVVYLVCSRSTFGFFRDFPALGAVLLRRRVVIHCHGSDIIDLLSCRKVSFLARLIYKRCEIVVPAKHLVADLKQLGILRINMCENFIVQHPKTTIDPTLQSGNKLLVVWNSNIMSSKGFFDTARAVELAFARGVTIKLLSLGEPLSDNEMSAAEVRQRLSALLDADWFDYRGTVSADEAIAYTAKADVVVLPSRYSSECQPLSLIQAMCYGVDVIVADTAALRDTVRDYPALILNNPTSENISNALERLQMQKADNNNDTKEKRQIAALRAQARFSKERFDRQMFEILRGSGNANEENS